MDGCIAAGRSTEGVQSIVAVQFTAAAQSTEAVWCVAACCTERPADIMAAMGSLAVITPIRHVVLDTMEVASIPAGSSIAVALPIVAVSHTGAVAFTAEEASTGVGAE